MCFDRWTRNLFRIGFAFWAKIGILNPPEKWFLFIPVGFHKCAHPRSCCLLQELPCFDVCNKYMHIYCCTTIGRIWKGNCPFLVSPILAQFFFIFGEKKCLLFLYKLTITKPGTLVVQKRVFRIWNDVHTTIGHQVIFLVPWFVMHIHFQANIVFLFHLIVLISIQAQHILFQNVSKCC